MANTSIYIQRMIFDTSDPDITKVIVEIKHDNPSNILLKCRYEKDFPAIIPVSDMLDPKSRHFILGGKNDFLFW